MLMGESESYRFRMGGPRRRLEGWRVRSSKNYLYNRVPVRGLASFAHRYGIFIVLGISIFTSAGKLHYVLSANIYTLTVISYFHDTLHPR